MGVVSPIRGWGSVLEELSHCSKVASGYQISAEMRGDL